MLRESGRALFYNTKMKERKAHMQTEIMVAILSLAGTLIGSWYGVKKSTDIVTYRIGQLEKKVDEHNNVIKRTYVIEEQVKIANHRISDLEDAGKR